MFIQITLDKPGGPSLVRNLPAVIRDRSNKDFTHPSPVFKMEEDGHEPKNIVASKSQEWPSVYS